jgi:hypothetical protein
MRRGYFKLSLLFICLVSLCNTHAAFGDGDCFFNKEMRASLDKAVAAEKRGEFAEAFAEYSNAKYESGCDGKNPVSADATAAVKRIASKMSDEEEKRGNLYKSAALGKGAGAFQWLEASERFAEADKMMRKTIKAKPEDIETFKIALGHFRAREERREDLSKYHGFNVDLSYLKELESAASRNGDNALNREEKEFLNNMIALGGTNVDRSIRQLSNAHQWFSFFKDAKEQQVIERAEKRGDNFYSDNNNPQSLEEAIRYYEAADDQGKIKKVREKAGRLAADAEKEGILLRAVHYYNIAGNHDKAERLEKRVQERSMKQEKEMFKDENQKKKFRKEQENLEKELGM